MPDLNATGLGSVPELDMVAKLKKDGYKGGKDRRRCGHDIGVRIPSICFYTGIS